MVKITKELSFPEDFYKFSTLSDKSNDITDNEINKWIKECIEELKQDNKRTWTQIASGNTRVIVIRENDKFNIYVMKDYWEFEDD